MGLQVTHHTPQGLISINQSHLSIAQRLSEWDSRFHVNFNRVFARYEIWRLGEDGMDRLVMTCSPDEFTHETVLSLMENDTRRVDVLAKVRAHNDRVEQKANEHLRDVEKEALSFLKWCDDRDVWTR